MSYRVILYQDLTKHVMTFSYMILLQVDISQEPTTALFNSNQKQRKSSLQALLLGGSKGLWGWQHSAWQRDMVPQRKQHATISLCPWGVFFFFFWVLQCSTATLPVTERTEIWHACLFWAVVLQNGHWNGSCLCFFLQVAEQLQYVIACILPFWRSLWLFFSLSESRSYDSLHRRKAIVQYDYISISIFKAGEKRKLVWEYKCSHNDMVRTSFKDRLQSTAVERIRTC